MNRGINNNNVIVFNSQGSANAECYMTCGNNNGASAGNTEMLQENTFYQGNF